MRVVIEFSSGESPREESHGMKVPGLLGDGQDAGDGVVRGVRFYLDLKIQFPVA